MTLVKKLLFLVILFIAGIMSYNEQPAYAAAKEVKPPPPMVNGVLVKDLKRWSMEACLALQENNMLPKHIPVVQYGGVIGGNNGFEVYDAYRSENSISFRMRLLCLNDSWNFPEIIVSNNEVLGVVMEYNNNWVLGRLVDGKWTVAKHGAMCKKMMKYYYDTGKRWGEQVEDVIEEEFQEP